MAVAERRARLGLRHHLATPAVDCVAATRGVVVLHATDPATVHLSALARGATAVADTERALYEERSLVRLLGMRRTVFVAPRELAPVVQASSTRLLLPVERRKRVGWIEAAGVAADGDRWLAALEAETEAALRARGDASAAQLAADVPALRTEVVVAAGTRQATPVKLTTHVLFLLSAAGRIVRGRPAGTWLSTQYRWAPADVWLGGLPEPSTEDAQAELVRRWLAAFGPAPVSDVAWWTGWTLRDVRRALAAVGAVEVDLDGALGVVAPDDLEPVEEPAPWTALLPALDPTPMGWKERGWFLGEHGPALFDRSGNIGPTVWADGRIVGGWAQRADGSVAVRLLEDIGAGRAAAIGEQADRLAATLGSIRVIPRFRTPLERELAG